MTADVLIVDDRPAQRCALRAALGDVSANVVEAESGRDALRLLLQRDFAVILLDVHMPGMDGFETAAWIRKRERSQDTPIIFVTVDSDEAQLRDGYRLGAVDYIQAPVAPEVLRTKVSFFVELHRRTAEARRYAESLERHASRLRRLSELSLAVHGLSSLDELLDAVVDAAREVIGADEAAAEAWLDPPGRQGSERPLRHALRKPQDSALATLPRPLLAELASRAARFGTAELGSSAYAEMLGELGGERLRGCLAAPLLRRDGELAGALQVSAKRDGDFTPDDQAVLVQIAQIASIALENTLFRDAQESNRMKDQFLATLSHELRTPLQAMLSWTSILRGTDADPALLAQGLEVIARSANAQKRLIDDLLEVSRIVSNKLRLELRPVSLASVVDAALVAARPVAAAKNVALAVDVTPEDVTVLGDADRLQQVLGNLLSNALKFTPVHGRVQVQLARRGGLAELRVRDSGEGIAPEFLPHIFERFRQADSSSSRPHGGLGIGLAIVRHLVELHEGRVRAESGGAGKGATFVVELPLALGEVEASGTERGLPRGGTPLAGVRILLVEDEDDARESLALLLRRRGAEVVAVGSAADALAALDVGCPDLLVSDIAMPGRDGLDLIAAVRARTDRAARVPAAALTAYARPEECARALRAGFDRHLSKPLQEDALLSAVIELTRARSPGPAAQEPGRT